MITSRPGQAGPPWSGAVMGTGIVAVATTSFPVTEPGLRVVGTVLRLLAAASLVALGVLRRVLVRLGTAGLALADTPTVVIVLGPFGQSVTAANLLAGEAQGLLPSRSPASRSVRDCATARPPGASRPAGRCCRRC